MLDVHSIEQFEDVDIFINKVKSYSEDKIECAYHTFFRLSTKQRGVFTFEVIKRFLIDDIPVRVGIQKNNNYSVFYKYKNNRYIRIIISFKPNKIKIVSFWILEKDKLPRGIL